MDIIKGEANSDKLLSKRPRNKFMVTYYYDMGEGLVYFSEQDLDYRILTKCKRCLRVEHGNAQVLKDNRNEWFDYPMDDSEISWIILKAKRIPRSWDKYNI